MTTSLRDRPTAPPSGPTRVWASRLTGLVDGVSDLAVAGFAAWTVLYHLGLLLGIPTNPLLVVWVVSLLALPVLLVRSAHAAGARSMSAVRDGLAALAGRPALVAIGLAVLSAACIGSDRSALWWPGWALMAAAAVVATWAVLGRLRAPADPVHDADAHAGADTGDESVMTDVERPAPRLGSLLALGTSLGLGIFSVFTLRPDPDDVFYVNRAQWIADHGTIPTRDTLYGNQKLPAIPGAGEPVSSIETLQGAIAHVLHLAAGTTAFLATPAVGTFLAVWAIWRLIRAWSPRRRTACFVVAVLYLLWAAQEGGMLGVFFLARMEQGKVVFVAALVPILYLYLTRWIERGTRRDALLLFAAGAAGVGCTSTATFVVPLICAAAGLPLLLQRRYRAVLGCLIPMAYPLVVGLVVSAVYPSVETGDFLSSQQTFHSVFGNHWFAGLGLLAVLLAFWLARAGAPRLLAVGIALVLVIVLAPGALNLMKDVIGAQPVLWRTMWVAPVPVLVGLAASVRLPDRVSERLPALGVVPALVLVAVVLTAGAPLWAPARNVQIVGHPTWRTYPYNLHQARAIIKHDHVPGPVLAEPRTMQDLSMSTTRLFPVSARNLYTISLKEPAPIHRARLALAALVQGGTTAPTVEALRADLRLLHVGVVCVPTDWTYRTALFVHAGYSEQHRVYRNVCLQRP